ncbi:hypothetical protein [Streptomyces sp. NRRL S-646]|uniref:hypothetical protein n=1 Tax=Streptomyces sp. NRRL S-646 TaxID=1463917 RepID=UPI0013313FC4|nr:hypothetical protein [Streptomyces sp. NRRL S-646]
MTANLLSVGGFFASAAYKLPAPVLPVAVLIFGGTGLYLLRRFLSSAVAARRAVLAATLVITLIVAYWASNHVWPDSFPLGKQSDKTGATKETRGPTTSAESGNLARGLKVSEPKSHGRIGTCTPVVGSGRIPEGYQIWVANLNDQGGKPDTFGLFNLRRATQEGVSEWTVSPFGVGADSDVGKNFWIFVYLLPESAGSMIGNLRLPDKDPGWRPSLNAPISGVDPIDKIPVQRTADHTCGSS